MLLQSLAALSGSFPGGVSEWYLKDVSTPAVMLFSRDEWLRVRRGRG